MVQAYEYREYPYRCSFGKPLTLTEDARALLEVSEHLRLDRPRVVYFLFKCKGDRDAFTRLWNSRQEIDQEGSR